MPPVKDHELLRHKIHNAANQTLKPRKVTKTNQELCQKEKKTFGEKIGRERREELLRKMRKPKESRGGGVNGVSQRWPWRRPRANDMVGGRIILA